MKNSADPDVISAATNLIKSARALDARWFIAIICAGNQAKEIGGPCFWLRVFARDPDALPDRSNWTYQWKHWWKRRKQKICKYVWIYLDAHFKWEDDLSQDDLLSSAQMMSHFESIHRWQKIALDKQITETKAAVLEIYTAWRIEGLLRRICSQSSEPLACGVWVSVHCLIRSALKDPISNRETGMGERRAKKEMRQKLRWKDSDRKFPFAAWGQISDGVKGAVVWSPEIGCRSNPGERISEEKRSVPF